MLITIIFVAILILIAGGGYLYYQNFQHKKEMIEIQKKIEVEKKQQEQKKVEQIRIAKQEVEKKRLVEIERKKEEEAKKQKQLEQAKKKAEQETKKQKKKENYIKKNKLKLVSKKTSPDGKSFVELYRPLEITPDEYMVPDLAYSSYYFYYYSPKQTDWWKSKEDWLYSMTFEFIDNTSILWKSKWNNGRNYPSVSERLDLPNMKSYYLGGNRVIPILSGTYKGMFRSSYEKRYLKEGGYVLTDSIKNKFGNIVKFEDCDGNGKEMTVQELISGETVSSLKQPHDARVKVCID